MKEGPDIARIAALIGDPARANILTALMSGKALTATELAREAGVTPQTASAHLAKLEDGGLLDIAKQGRHKYIRLANDDVAHTLEALMGLAAKSGHLRNRTGPKDPALRAARVCYNHLAGDMGVHMFDSLISQGLIKGEDDIKLTAKGTRFATGFGIDLAPLTAAKSALCRPCLDWSERRTHLAGSLGRAILSAMEEKGWARRSPDSRAIFFTAKGKTAFAETFPV